jgi:hypothetical protein
MAIRASVKENSDEVTRGSRYQEGIQGVAPEFIEFPCGKYRLVQDRGGGKP